MGLTCKQAGPIRLSSNGVEALLISADGNVGIGTSAPINRLDVNGMLRMEPTTQDELRLDNEGHRLCCDKPGGSGLTISDGTCWE